MTRKCDTDLEIIPTESMVKDLGVLLGLKAAQISAFAESVNSEDGFGIPKDTNLAQLIRSVSVTGDEFEQIYRISKFLYDRLAEKEGIFEDLFEATQAIAREHDLPSPTRKKKAFRELFSVPSDYQKKRKFEPYQRGIVHKLSAIAYTNELRAVFDNDSNEETKILGYIPVASIRLVAEDDKDERQTLLFTVDDESLDKLIKRFAEIKGKLTLVREDLSGKGVEIQ